LIAAPRNEPIDPIGYPFQGRPFLARNYKLHYIIRFAGRVNFELEPDFDRHRFIFNSWDLMRDAPICFWFLGHVQSHKP
jgi:hypothetical protein